VAGASTTRRLPRSAKASRASSVYPGAITTSVNTSPMAAADSPSTFALNAVTPPNADTGSDARAAR
jgi:hypothetical protein